MEKDMFYGEECFNEIDYLNIFKNNEVDGIIFLAKTISNRHLEIIEN